VAAQRRAAQAASTLDDFEGEPLIKTH